MATDGTDWSRETETAVLEEIATGADDSPESGPKQTRPVLTGQESSETRPSGSTGVNDGEDCTRYSFSHWNPEPGFAHIDGDIGGLGYNETKVDIVCVPCPGADPVDTWARDPLPDDYFGQLDEQDLTRQPTVKELAGGSILSPAINRHLPKAAHIWVRQGIRKEINTARVLLYRHCELTDGLNLDTLAEDLLAQVWQQREGNQRSRPLFFIAHSIGGLVVKLALLKASISDHYRPFLYNCHGVTFFSTPHRGSSYMSMHNLEDSIQNLLGLQRALPRSISNILRLGNQSLLKLQEDFTGITSELRIWTFYETVDSQLSGTGSTGPGMKKEVQFGAPLASIKSTILGVRQEQAYSLESDHAHCASFGKVNEQTMDNYLGDLAAAVHKAADISAMYVHTPLNLKKHVKVEMIAFYEDPVQEMETAIRLYFTKLHLEEFLAKGPERCLEERLKKTPFQPFAQPVVPSNNEAGGEGSRGTQGLGLWTNVQELSQKIWRGRSRSGSQPPSPETEEQISPGIVVTRPSVATGSTSMPATAMRRMQSLTVPPLSTPGFHRRLSSRASNTDTASTASDPTGTESKEVSPTDVDPATPHAKIDRGIDKTNSEPTVQRRAERLSKASMLEDLSAGFSRPDPAKRRFMWIHVPFNNPPWVKDIFEVLASTHGQSFAKLFNNDNWVSKHIQGRHSQTQASFVKSACSFIPPVSAPSPRHSPSTARTSSPSPSPAYLYLYLPYLHFDTYVNLINRRNILKRRMMHGRARPVPQDIAELDSMEMKVIWEYIGFDPPLNYRRTLDQFSYPSLRDTYARDDDQMLYKLTKERASKPSTKEGRRPLKRGTMNSIWSPSDRISPTHTGLLYNDETDESDVEDDEDLEEHVKDGKVLMVDQLWLWSLDTTTLSTFFAKRESRPQEGPLFQQADLRNSVYNELNGDLTGRCENALDLAGFIVLHAVTVLLDRSSHPDLEIFRIFEEAISMLTERMTSSLKRFRMQPFKEVNFFESEDESADENRSESIKKRHKRELKQAERENRENTSALLELRDLEDELNSLGRLFETQDAAIRQMKSYFDSDDLKDVARNGRTFLDEALARLDEYKSQTAEMIKRVDTTRNDYEKLLEMVQRQAQVDEVRWSRLQTELASSQNLSVMIFTTFTVIFLPLSFFTGLFGMNTREWGGEEFLHIGTIGAIALPVSAFLIGMALLAAFSTRVQYGFKSAFKLSKAVVEWTKRSTRQMLPRKARRKKMQRRVAREEKNVLRSRKRDRGYDFWETVKKQRASEYRIPDLNRKRPERVTTRIGEKALWDLPA